MKLLRANVVMHMVQFLVLYEEAVATGIPSLADDHALCTAFRDLYLCAETVCPVERFYRDVFRHHLCVREINKRLPFLSEFGSFIAQSRSTSTVERKPVVLAGFGVPECDHLDESTALRLCKVPGLRWVISDVIELPTCSV